MDGRDQCQLLRQAVADKNMVQHLAVALMDISIPVRTRDLLHGILQFITTQGLDRFGPGIIVQIPQHNHSRGWFNGQNIRNKGVNDPGLRHALRFRSQWWRLDLTKKWAILTL